MEEITGKEQQIACGKIRGLSTMPAAELRAGTLKFAAKVISGVIR